MNSGSKVTVVVVVKCQLLFIFWPKLSFLDVFCMFPISMGVPQLFLPRRVLRHGVIFLNRALLTSPCGDYWNWTMFSIFECTKIFESGDAVRIQGWKKLDLVLMFLIYWKLYFLARLKCATYHEEGKERNDRLMNNQEWTIEQDKI